MAPKSLFRQRTWSLVVVLSLFLLSFLNIDFMIWNFKIILRRTFMTRHFIRNTKSVFLIFQNMPLPDAFRLWDGYLYMSNLWDVAVCLYKSFTPTYMLSIFMSLCLLWYSKEHISYLHQSSSSSPVHLSRRANLTILWESHVVGWYS